MKNSLRFYSFIIYLLIIIPTGILTCAPTETNDKIIQILSDEGFENLYVFVIDSDILIAYENRIYRDEVESIERVIELIIPEVANFKTLRLIVQNRNIPVMRIEMGIEKYFAYLKGKIKRDALIGSMIISLDTDSLWKQIKSQQRISKTELETDLIINPQLKSRFGQFDNPVRLQLGIKPTIKTTLGQGLSIYAELIIPFHDELDPEHKFIRPGIVAMNQTIKLPGNLYMALTLGQFENFARYGIDDEHRYGLDFEIKKYFNEGIWAIGANLGYTGESSYRDKIWRLKTMDVSTYSLNTVFRWEKYNLSLAAKAGKFIYGDKGIRVDVNRQFGEVEIGFFAIAAGGEKNGGFNFSIPIFPSKYYSSTVRLLLPSHFSYEYRAKAFPREGQMYGTGYSIENFKKRLSRDYVESFLFK